MGHISAPRSRQHGAIEIPLRSGETPMRLPTRTFTIALLAVTACASSSAVPHRESTVPLAVGSTRDSTLPTESEQATAIVHIVNMMPQAYRVSIALDGVARVLGSVPGFETRDFPIDRRSIAGNPRCQLFVAERDGARPRDSEFFPLSGARGVTWILDSRLLHFVTLR